MTKIFLSLGILLAAGFAQAQMVISNNEKFCGKVKVFEFEDRIKYSYFAVLVLDRPSVPLSQEKTDNITQDMLDHNTVGLWLMDSTQGAEEDGANVVKETVQTGATSTQTLTVAIPQMKAKLVHNQCYCIDGSAGGALDYIMGFQIITKIEDASCSDSK